LPSPSRGGALTPSLFPRPRCIPGFVEPGATYRGDAADPKAQPRLFRATKLSVDHNPAGYEVEQVRGGGLEGKGCRADAFTPRTRGLRRAQPSCGAEAPPLTSAGVPARLPQIFATSRDGTKIPMFVTHAKGLKLDGSNPTLLYGYGGFNISLEPAFSPSRLTWLKAYGGVYVQVCQGGGAAGRCGARRCRHSPALA
jgi:hypothetical protein